MKEEALSKEEIDTLLEKQFGVVEKCPMELSKEEYEKYIRSAGGMTGGTEVLSQKETERLLDAINGDDGQTNDHLCGGKNDEARWDKHMLETVRWKLRSALKIVEDLLK